MQFEVLVTLWICGRLESECYYSYSVMDISVQIKRMICLKLVLVKAISGNTSITMRVPTPFDNMKY